MTASNPIIPNRVQNDREKVEALAKEVLASKIEGKTVVKEIYVPGKIVNLIVK